VKENSTYAGMSFEDVTKEFSDNVTRICISATGNYEDAKDCFQNTFLKLYTSKKSFNNKEHLKAWLLRVAINECKDYHRSFWKRNVDFDYDYDKFFATRSTMKCGDTDEMETLLTALRSLPYKYYQIIYLYYIEGYNTSEISELLHMSCNTVKSRLNRGRKILKERWNIYE
jgi:RNA polymerase sigma factor, sigma-70 family